MGRSDLLLIKTGTLRVLEASPIPANQNGQVHNRECLHNINEHTGCDGVAL